MNGYALFFLVAVAIGGVAWVFIYPIISGERHAERRKASVARAEPIAARPTRVAQKSRREQVEGTLKDIELRQKAARRVPLAIRITQAGLTWSKRRFLLTAGALGVAAFLLALPTGAGLLAALGFAFAAWSGASYWALIGMSAATVGIYGSRAAFWPMPSLFLTGTAAAGAIALINATGNLGGYFGPFVVGWIKDSTGKFEAGLYFLAACSLMCAVITYFAARAAGDPAAMIRANAAAAAE